MAKAMWDVKDTDAASTLASRLESLGAQEINDLAKEMQKKAAEIAEIDGTLEFNVQLSRYLEEAATVFQSVAEPIENAGRLLASIVASASDFAEQSQRGTLI